MCHWVSDKITGEIWILTSTIPILSKYNFTHERVVTFLNMFFEIFKYFPNEAFREVFQQYRTQSGPGKFLCIFPSQINRNFLYTFKSFIFLKSYNFLQNYFVEGCKPQLQIFCVKIWSLYWKTRQIRKLSNYCQLFWDCRHSVQNSLHISKPNFWNISLQILVWWRNFSTTPKLSDISPI